MTTSQKYLRQIVFLVFCCISSVMMAQKDAAADVLQPYRLLIPRIEVLIDSALANHGMLAFRKNDIRVREENLKMKKRNWTRNIGFEADSRYGTFNRFSGDNTSSGTINVAANRTQFNYGVGVFLKIPVADIYNRKSEIKQAEVGIVQAKNLVKQQSDEIRETVIRYYEDLILKQNLMLIQAKNLSDGRVNLEMAKKEYTNGKLLLYDYISISDNTRNIQAEFERAKSALLVSKQLLENITGVIIK